MWHIAVILMLFMYYSLWQLVKHARNKLCYYNVMHIYECTASYFVLTYWVALIWALGIFLSCVLVSEYVPLFVFPFLHGWKILKKKDSTTEYNQIRCFLRQFDDRCHHHLTSDNHCKGSVVRAEVPPKLENTFTESSSLGSHQCSQIH